MKIKKAVYVEKYKMKIDFSDGCAKIVDFQTLLKNAENMLKPLLDLEYFKNFYVDGITVCWPNGVDFCPDVLYELGTNVQKKQADKTLTRHRKQTSNSKVTHARAYALSKKRNLKK